MPVTAFGVCLYPVSVQAARLCGTEVVPRLYYFINYYV